MMNSCPYLIKGLWPPPSAVQSFLVSLDNKVEKVATSQRRFIELKILKLQLHFTKKKTNIVKLDGVFDLENIFGPCIDI